MKRAFSILLAVLLVLFALPAVAEEGNLKAGLYASDAGTELIYLNEEGVGVLNFEADGLYYANGIVWTEASLEIEQVSVPYAMTEDLLTFTFSNKAFALRYQGLSDAYGLGAPEGTDYAGTYLTEDGKKLVLESEGRGVYADDAGEQPLFWGSLTPYWKGAEGACFVLFNSYLSGLTFSEGTAVLNKTADEELVFARAPETPEAPEKAPEAGMVVISSTYDLAVTLPAGDWTVEETDGGLLIVRQKDMIQYTFLSLLLENEPAAATLDFYADHIWNDSLMGMGVAYDANETVRDDRAVGEAAGRAAATEWVEEDALMFGNSVLWYANGRLYAVLCVSTEATQPEALTILDGALTTLRTAGELALDREGRLLVDKEAFEAIRELPTGPVVTEQVFYGYRMITNGQVIEIVPFMSAIGVDPKSICLTLKSDGTGTLQMMEEGVIELSWTEDTLTGNDETIAYTRNGEHIVVSEGEEIVEFAPAAEIEELIAQLNAAATAEPVTPTVEELIGNWNLTKARALGLEVTAEQMGSVVSLVFHEDGTAIELEDGTPNELEWTILEDGRVSVTFAGVEKYVLTYNGTVLTYTVADGLDMIFEKEV